MSPTSLFSVDSGTGTTFNTGATNSGTSGLGTITATLTSCGLATTITKSVWVGSPSSWSIQLKNMFTQMPIYELCSGEANYLEASYSGNLTIDDWGWGGDWSVGYPNYPDKSIASVTPYGYSSYGVVSVRAHNSCGWSFWNYNPMTVVSCGGGYYYSMSQNPTSNELTISFTKSNGNASEKSKVSGTPPPEANVSVSVEIYNSTQTRLLSANGNISDGDIKINTSSLKPGSYIVHVLVNDKVHKKHLLIE